MKNVVIVSSGDLSKLAVIRDRFPEAEVITPEEARERYDIEYRPRISDIPIHKKPDIPVLERIPVSRNMDAQSWKRRGKNTKV